MNSRVRWTPMLWLVVVLVTIFGLFGLVILAGVVLALLTVGVRPVHADD